MRRRLPGLAAVLAVALAVPGCADPAVVPEAAPPAHPCGAGVDPATARVVDVYAATLRHLVASGRHGEPGARVLYLVDHAVPEFQETGILEAEKRTPAPASDSTAPFPPAVRRCLESARFDGLPPIKLVKGWGDPAIRTERLAVEGWPAGHERPLRIVDGRLFSLGGVPADEAGWPWPPARSAANTTPPAACSSCGTTAAPGGSPARSVSGSPDPAALRPAGAPRTPPARPGRGRGS